VEKEEEDEEQQHEQEEEKSPRDFIKHLKQASEAGFRVY
jgi:hypothetical protein